MPGDVAEHVIQEAERFLKTASGAILECRGAKTALEMMAPDWNPAFVEPGAPETEFE